MLKPQQEIIQQSYPALVNSLGVVDAIRFIQHFTPSQGDYTRDRHQWLDQTPPEEILESMRQHREDDRDRYDEIIDH